MFNVGDKVKLSEWYRSLYPGWSSSLKDRTAIIENITRKTVRFQDLDKDTKPIYRTAYGDAPTYELLGIYIRFEGDTYQYLVSNLGVVKV